MQDADGNIVPNATNEITFDIAGNGEIVGVDNGDPVSRESYKDSNGVWKRKAFSGKALVIVHATDEAGSFTITASGNGLEPSSVTVETDAEKPYIDTDVPTEPTQVPVVNESQSQITQNTNTSTAQTSIGTVINAGNNIAADTATNEAKKFTKGKLKYTIINARKKTVQVNGAIKKSVKKLVIPSTVTCSGTKYKVIRIAAKAFKNHKKLSQVKHGKNIQSIGRAAFMGISKKAVFDLPRKKASLYGKLLRKSGCKK